MCGAVNGMKTAMKVITDLMKGTKVLTLSVYTSLKYLTKKRSDVRFRAVSSDALVLIGCRLQSRALAT